MCGRFALGVPANEIRAGIVHHFPRMFNNPRAAARRARQGDEGRARQRQDRQRRRGRQAGSSGAGRSQQVQVQPEADEEEFEWPASDEEAQAAGVQGDEDEQALAARLRWENEERFRQGNFNVAPRSNGVVLRLRPTPPDGADLRLRGGGEGGEAVEVTSKTTGDLDVGNQELVIETMQWGLIPHWSKHPPTGALNTINARSENLIDNAGGMWQSLKGPKRCLVVVQGYYEWQKKGTTKIPHFTKLPPTEDSVPHLMLLAGLYDEVKYVDAPASDPPIKTFTILTTTPSKSLQFLHDRMPCILEKEEECVRWLDCRDGWKAEVAKLLRPYDGEVECYPVPTEVGKIGNNSPSFVLPVKERKDGIASFFKKQTGEASAAKASEQPHKDKDNQDVKHTPGKRGLETDARGVAAPVDKKPKIEKGGRVHSPVPACTIDVDVKSDEKPAESPESGRSQPDKEDEKAFELGIGDDSNAPNPSTPIKTKAKGKGKGASVSPEVSVVSTRQTRSSGKKVATKQEEHDTAPLGRRGQKHKSKQDDEEVQVLSSPEPDTKRTINSSLKPDSSAAKRGHVETKVNKSEIRGEKAKGATIRGGTGEDGLESTHQTKLDGFLKHEE